MNKWFVCVAQGLFCKNQCLSIDYFLSFHICILYWPALSASKIRCPSSSDNGSIRLYHLDSSVVRSWSLENNCHETAKEQSKPMNKSLKRWLIVRYDQTMHCKVVNCQRSFSTKKKSKPLWEKLYIRCLFEKCLNLFEKSWPMGVHIFACTMLFFCWVLHRIAVPRLAWKISCGFLKL